MRAAANKRVFMLLAFIVPFAIYLATLDNALVRDDIYFVEQNEWITDLENIPEIVSSPVWDFQGKQGLSNQYRPTYHLFFMAGYALSGTTPWGFHLVNTIVHSLASLMVFLIAARIIEEREGQGASGASVVEGVPYLALISALAFGVHPINTEPVAWISAISEVSFGLFSLGAIYFYITARRLVSARFCVALVLYFLAACSKETAAVVPLIFFFSDSFVFNRRVAESIKRLIPIAALGFVYIVMRFSALKGVVPLETEHLAGLGPLGLLLNVPPLFVKYLSKLLLPVGLNFDYVFTPVRALSEPAAFVPVIAAGVVAVCAYLAYRLDKKIFFSLLWIFIALVPALYIPALGENVFTERYLYLSSAGFSIFLALLALRAYVSISWAGLKAPLFALAVVVFLLYSAGTLARVEVFEKSLTLWGDTVQKSPDSRIARNNFGIELAREGRLDEAAAEFREAIRIDPLNELAYNNLGTIYARKGEIRRAAEEFRRATELAPQNEEAQENLRKALMMIQTEGRQ